MNKLLQILFCFGMSLNSHCQKLVPKFTYNIELGLPVAVANRPFDDIMQGLVSANSFVQYSFPFHLNVGAGIKYSYFVVNQFATTTPVHGGIHSGGGFVKVGYDKFVTDRFAIDLGVKVGYMDNYILTDKNKENGTNPVRIQSSLIEPVIGLILTADERNSYRLNIGYVIQGYGFQPKLLGVNSNENYNTDNFNNPTQYFYVGFGYTFYFGVKGGE